MGSRNSRIGTSEPLDHGELQVPLAKRYGRGGIDGAIDRHLATERKEEKRRGCELAREVAEKREECKAIIAKMSDARLAELGAPHGLTIKQARAELLRAVRSNSFASLHALSKERNRPDFAIGEQAR